jgi:UPF0755 protein
VTGRREDADDVVHTERRLIRMSPGAGGGRTTTERPAPSIHEDAVTDRHYAAAWRRPEPPAEEEDDDAADPGWLLGGDLDGVGDDDDATTTTTTTARDDGDADTELLPHGRPPRSRRLLWPGIALLLVVVLAGGVFFARDLFPVIFPPDYDGPGTGRVVVEVADGASTRAIGEELATADVVASARAFGSAAEEDPDGRGIQPGFYQLRRQMSAAGAVDALLDPASRVGRLDVRSGTQLDDTAGPGNTTVPGVLSQIAQATCVAEDAGGTRCATVDELRAAMADTDPAQLGVAPWALDGARRAAPSRRLEGLLAPGAYDIAPGTSARDALAQVVRASVPRLETGGLVAEADAAGVSPYDVLVVASLSEREGVAGDFGKVARVIYNRLAVPMRLQLDSTVNYPLDRQTLLTSPVDRATPGPYNTYLNLGLTPTPIGAVSPDALRAALEPTPGPWVYFVKCQVDGESCFAVTPVEHDANRRLAQERGVY